MTTHLKTRGRGLLAQQREARAWHWRLRGLSWHETAAQLADEGLGKGPDGRTPLSRGAVCAMIERVRERLRIETQEETDRQLAALNLIVAESLDAWDRSKADYKRTVEKIVASDPPPASLPEAPAPVASGRPGRKESVIEVEHRCGERLYLEQARRALADIRAILGIKAPEKVDVTSGGKPVRSITYTVIPPMPAPQELEDEPATRESVG